MVGDDSRVDCSPWRLEWWWAVRGDCWCLLGDGEVAAGGEAAVKLDDESPEAKGGKHWGLVLVGGRKRSGWLPEPASVMVGDDSRFDRSRGRVEWWWAVRGGCWCLVKDGEVAPVGDCVYDDESPEARGGTRLEKAPLVSFDPWRYGGVNQAQVQVTYYFALRKKK